MNVRPMILDLFCGAGGAGEGYRRAGFDVVGVDIVGHSYPPGRFIRGDALAVLAAVAADGMLDGVRIDAIHLSPPCQRWATNTPRPAGHPDYITPARPLLDRWSGPYIIENVVGAPLIDPIMLCGSAFGLAVRRHRAFETNWSTGRPPACQHDAQGDAVGVYGQHPDRREHQRTNGKRRGARATTVFDARRAMGIDWMHWEDLTEAIPPAYTQWLGAQLVERFELSDSVVDRHGRLF